MSTLAKNLFKKLDADKNGTIKGIRRGELVFCCGRIGVGRSTLRMDTSNHKQKKEDSNG